MSKLSASQKWKPSFYNVKCFFSLYLLTITVASHLIPFYPMGLYIKINAFLAKMIIYENNLEITYFSSMTIRGSGRGVGPFEGYTKLEGWTHFEKNTCFSRIYKGEWGGLSLSNVENGVWMGEWLSWYMGEWKGEWISTLMPSKLPKNYVSTLWVAAIDSAPQQSPFTPPWYHVSSFEKSILKFYLKKKSYQYGT